MNANPVRMSLPELHVEAEKLAREVDAMVREMWHRSFDLKEAMAVTKNEEEFKVLDTQNRVLEECMNRLKTSGQGLTP